VTHGISGFGRRGGMEAVGRLLRMHENHTWARGALQCEARLGRSRPGCNARLVWGARGQEKYLASWEAHHVTAGGPDVVSNCEILCIPCHVKTRTYGG